MGRPVNSRYLGKPEGDEFKINGIANIGGQEKKCWIARQRSVSAFDIIDDETDLVHRGFSLVANDEPSEGEFYVKVLDEGSRVEFARKITNRRVYTFSGESSSWPSEAELIGTNEPMTLVIDTNLITGTTFELPIVNGTGSIRVDWGDETEENFETLTGVSHEYASDGEYEINVYSTNKDSTIGNEGFTHRDALTEVRNWGNFRYRGEPETRAVVWFDTFSASSDGSNLVYIETPPPSMITLGRMFEQGSSSSTFNFSSELDITGWDVSYIRSFSRMFLGSNFNQDISNWDISNVNNMGAMFDRAATFNQDISNWDVGNVTNMSFMFVGAATFNQNLGSWELNPEVDLLSMFDNTSMSPENYSRTLIGWANNIYERGGVVTDRELGAQGIQYSENTYGDITGQFDNFVDARDYLVNDLNWTITDDGVAPIATFASVTDFENDTTLTVENTNEGDIIRVNDVELFPEFTTDAYYVIVDPSTDPNSGDSDNIFLQNSSASPIVIEFEGQA